MSETTQYRVRSAWFSALLQRGAQLSRSPACAPVNDLVRSIYVSLVVPALEARLGQILGVKLRCVPRHSVLKSRDFSFLESDLDLSVIFESEPDPVTLKCLLSEYGSWRRRLPFLGELEVYSEEEEAQKRSLQGASQVGPLGFDLIQIVQLLRKWGWEREKLESAPSEYHRGKALRAISKVRSKLCPDGTFEAVSKHLESLAEAGALQEEPAGSVMESGFLTWKLCLSAPGETARVEESTRELWLPRKAFCALSALLPDSGAKSGLWLLSPRLSEERRALAQAELLLVQSVKRTRPDSPGLAGWEAQLKRIALSP